MCLTTCAEPIFPVCICRFRKAEFDKASRSLLRSALLSQRFMLALSSSNISKQSGAKHVLKLNRSSKRSNYRTLWSRASSKSASAIHKMFGRWAMWCELATVSPAVTPRLESALIYLAIAHQRLMHVVVMLQVWHETSSVSLWLTRIRERSSKACKWLRNTRQRY